LKSYKYNHFHTIETTAGEWYFAAQCDVWEKGLAVLGTTNDGYLKY